MHLPVRSTTASLRMTTLLPWSGGGYKPPGVVLSEAVFRRLASAGCDRHDHSRSRDVSRDLRDFAHCPPERRQCRIRRGSVGLVNFGDNNQRISPIRSKLGLNGSLVTTDRQKIFHLRHSLFPTRAIERDSLVTTAMKGGAAMSTRGEMSPRGWLGVVVATE